METHSFQSNELIAGISILAVLKHARELDIAKCVLIEPILSYTKVLNALRRKNSSIKSIEDLVVKESISFANFNDRFQEKLILSMNAILLFQQMKLLEFCNTIIIYKGDSFSFSTRHIGKSAGKRVEAARLLSKILTEGEASDLYLSLRVEL